jgi:hypothetical protein
MEKTNQSQWRHKLPKEGWRKLTKASADMSYQKKGGESNQSQWIHKLPKEGRRKLTKASGNKSSQKKGGEN